MGEITDLLLKWIGIITVMYWGGEILCVICSGITTILGILEKKQRLNYKIKSE